jgi:hypothetical protein
VVERVELPFLDLGREIGDRPLVRGNHALERGHRGAARGEHEPLAIDRRSRAQHARHLAHLRHHVAVVVEGLVAAAEDADVRGRAQDLGTDLALQAGHEPERHHQRHHATTTPSTEIAEITEMKACFRRAVR